MLNERKTLKNLHEAFPKLSLDDLFKILDCYVDTYQIETPHYWADGVRLLNNTNYERTISQPNFTTSSTCSTGSCKRSAN